MRIEFTDSEYSHLETLMKRINIPIKYLGCSENDRSISVSPNVTLKYIREAESACDSAIKRNVVRKKFLETLRSLPPGALKKGK